MIELDRNFQYFFRNSSKATRLFFNLSPRLAILAGTFWVANAAHSIFSPLRAIAAPNIEIVVVNSFSPTSADPGVAVDYTIFFQNDNPSNDAAISNFNHTLPQGPDSPGVLVFDSVTPTSDTCNLAPTITLGSNASSTPGSISLNSGVIPANSECQLTLSVKGFSGGPHIATIPTGVLVTDQGENAQPTSATLSISPSVPATIAKGFSPSTIPGDGQALATITLTNPNSFNLTGAILADTLPGALTVDTRSGAPAPATDCGTSATISGTTTITLADAEIAGGGSCTLTFPVTSTIGSVYTNTIPENSLVTDNGISNDQAANADLSVQAGIEITKSMAADQLVEGESTQLTIDIVNGGGGLDNVNLIDNLPTPLVVANVPNATTTCTSSGGSSSLSVTSGGSSVELNNANVSGSAAIPTAVPSTNTLGSCSITLTVTADPDVIGNVTDEGIQVANTIPADTLTSNSNPVDHEEASDILDIFPALVVSKSYSNNNTISPGNTARLTITVTNNSSIQDATNVSFTDTFPSPNLTIASSPNVTHDDCGLTPTIDTSNANSLAVSDVTIVAGETCTIEVDVMASSGASENDTYDNVINHDSVGNDQGFDSDGVTNSEGRVTVVRRVEVAKRFEANTVRRGVPSTLIIEISNNRRFQALTGVTITDDFPPNLEVANPPNFSHERCSHNGAAPVFTGLGATGGTTAIEAGDTTIAMTGGAIAPINDGNAETDTCIIAVDVVETELDYNYTDPINAPAPNGNQTPRTYTNTTSNFTNTQGETSPPATATLEVISALDAEKFFQSPIVAPGGRSTVVVQVNNTFPDPLTNLTLTDSWSQTDVTVANPANTRTTCGTGSFNINAARNELTFSGGTVPRRLNGTNGICEVRFDVVLNSANGTFNNVIAADGGSPDLTVNEGFTLVEDIEATLTSVDAEMSIVKEFDILSLVTGDPTLLTVTLENPSSGIALTELGFVDVMPADMKVFSNDAATTCPGTPKDDGSLETPLVSAPVGGNQFSLANASLGVGQSCTVTVRIAPTSRGNLTNLIPKDNVTSKENVTNPFPAAATITGNPALRPTKTFDREEIAGGVPSQMTLTIENLQTNTETGEDLTNVSLTDNLPTDLLVANPANASTDCPNGTLVANPGGTTVTLTGATLSPTASCEILVDVTSTVEGTYVNQIARGDVEGSIQASLGGTTIQNFDTAEDTLIVTDDIGLSELLLVKRITGVNGATENPNDSTDLNGFINEASSTDDDAPNWPLEYIRGAVDGGGVVEDDVVEYTIYFRNAGQRDAASVKICDRIQPYQSLLLGSFTGADMELEIGSNPIIPLTAAGDSADRAQLLPPGAPVPSSCNITEANTNGVVVLDVTGNTGTPMLPLLPRLGQNPDNSYGLLRLRTRIQPE